MDLFLRLVATILSSIFGDRNASIWNGTTYKFRTYFWERLPGGALYPSRVASFVDISLINFFVRTRMSAVVRKHGWVPVLLGSVQVRHKPVIPKGPLRIHTKVVGWQDHFVEISHTWSDKTDTEFLHCNYLTRVAASDRSQVSGEDMLVALNEDVVHKPLSDLGQRQLAQYLQLRAEGSARD